MSSFRGGMWTVSVKGDADEASGIRTANNVAAIRYVTSGFFQTLGIPLKRGRDIAVGDARDEVVARLHRRGPADESPEAAEARRRLLPFRDLFAVLFFVAIGTLINPDAFVAGLPWLALIVGLVVVAKVAVAYGLARFAGLRGDPRQVGIGLGQVGEFSFVLGSTAAASGAIGPEVYAAILGAVVITIIGSTVLVRLVGHSPPADGTPAAAAT